MQRNRRLLAAHAGQSLHLSGTAPATLVAAAADAPAAPRKFSMTAYNGGLMSFEWADTPVVVDLAGLVIAQRAHPIFLGHDPDQIVGHTSTIEKTATDLAVSGVVSGAGEAARQVVESADRGFPWQASIGVTIKSTRRVAANDTVTVNGQTFDGPVLVVTASEFFETSFVPLGADSTTTARMVAAANPPTKENPMDFEQWLASLGFDAAALSEEQKAVLQKAYDAEMQAAKAKAEQAEEAPQKAEAAASVLRAALVTVSKLAASQTKQTTTAKTDVEKLRAEYAAESKRCGEIRTVCAGKHATIEAKAMAENWTKEKTELEVLRAERAQAPAIHASQESTVDGNVLQAGLLLASRLPNVEKMFDSKTLEAAARRFRGHMGLQEFLLEAAWANGYSGRTVNKSNLREVMQAAFSGQLQAAGFSTIDVSGILANTANKFLLAGFMGVEQVWRQIAAIRNVSDFKTITSHRLTADLKYEKVGPAGEIKHGTLGEETYTNKAETYGKMLAITRQDIINDDLGALNEVPKHLGRGAGLKLNEVFWTEFFANAGTFYSTGNKNKSSGAGSALGIDGLTAAEALFLDQVDAAGQPLGLSPRYLLTPTALSAKAAALMNSTELRDTTANTKAPTGNPHAGKFETLVSSYLANALFGNSATGWYLIADPADIPLIEVALLNGQEAPTVETADADFNTLGIQMRGFHDFGVAKQDHRAGVYSVGS